MTAPAQHALSPQPFPVVTPGGYDPLAAEGLRLDYRTACQPWGAHAKRSPNMRIFTVAVGPDGQTDWSRVTCKGCNGPVPPTRKSGETHA